VNRERKIIAIREREVLTMVKFKTAVFWNVTPFILVDDYQPFRGTSCCRHQSSKRSLLHEGAGSRFF
jgi:hypothetical protein